MKKPTHLRNMRPVGNLFRVYYEERNPRCGSGSPDDGVAEISVLDDFVRGLERGHKRLTSAEYGWPNLSRLPIDVYVASLGNVCGLASPAFSYGGVNEVAYLAFNTRGNEPSFVDAKQRRAATAVHELTHLFQFELNTPGPWEWSDEAVATAMESHVLRGNRDHFRYLWHWVTQPHVSLDANSGYSAAPFATYLMRDLGPSIMSDIYKLGQQSGGKLQAIDAIAQALQSDGMEFASVDKPDFFASRYCVDAYFLRNESGSFGDKIFERFGDRAVSESFCEYPVADAASANPIDHLGCRYYRFQPRHGSSQLTVTVDLSAPNSRESLRGELVAVSRSSLPGSRQTLARSASNDQMSATLENFTEHALDHAVLILANVAYGMGASNHDGTDFSISANVV